MKLIQRLLFASLTILSCASSQAVMTNNVLKFRTVNNPGVLSLRVNLDDVSPPQDPYEIVNINYVNSKGLFSFLRFERQIRAVQETAGGVGPRIYLAHKGDVVTGARLDAGAFRLISQNAPNPPPPLATVGRDFWLVIAVRPIWETRAFVSFSWAHIRFNAQGLPEVVDSITAHREPGLVVGDKTPCKAPACLAAAATP